ncbi:hypothetical protein, partial [Rhodococcus olei]|uniref:hypothetical protein n=1 Tax=Rhodococcus olei TaxID=2161675 RepID=UPI0031EF1D0F
MSAKTRRPSSCSESPPLAPTRTHRGINAFRRTRSTTPNFRGLTLVLGHAHSSIGWGSEMIE